MNIGTEVGKVLWFDKKKGYGFVKVIGPDSEFLNKDVFVHYSTIICESNFKALYPGECVSLNVEEDRDENTDKQYKTSNVTGIYGTGLMVDNNDFIIKVIRKSKDRLQDISDEESGVDDGQEEVSSENELNNTQ